MLAVERDVNSRNINFAKVDRRGGGAINRKGAFYTEKGGMLTCCEEDYV